MVGIARQVTLRFAPKLAGIREDLSAACLSPDGFLWLASDETQSLERLAWKDQEHYADHRHYELSDLLGKLPAKGEIDIEGLDYSGSYLWLIGSHSAKRGRIESDWGEVKNIDQLAQSLLIRSSCLLARIPLVAGEPRVVYPDGVEPELRAARLAYSKSGNSLLDELRTDRHFGAFLDAEIPGKDNGFNIEGLAARGERLVIGLRGPVLQGWAVLLELEVREPLPGLLKLCRLGPTGERYRKHFLDLGGLGIRDLCWSGDDLLILAGPTMELDGSIRLFRLSGGPRAASGLIYRAPGVLELLLDIPHAPGADRAEGIALLPTTPPAPSQLLVVYDRPVPERKPDDCSVFADVFTLAP